LIGIYPVNLETVKINHQSADAGKFTRRVDFKFNYMMPLISRAHARQHRLEHLWPEDQTDMTGAYLK
jgi:hypothetical protein